LVLVLGLTGCKKKEEPPPPPRVFGAAAHPAAGAQAAPGQQKAQPGQQKAQPGQQKAQPGQQKAQPGQQKGAAPAATRGTAAPVPAATAARGAVQTPPAAAAPAAVAQAARADSTADSLHVDYRREVFSYQGGARDPFGSLLKTSEAQTTTNDLRLVSILYDARGGRSVAIVRDKNNPRPYRLRRGDTIGRLRVIQIRQYEVVLQVEEFGFERQEVLALTRREVNR
jgi:hypothetical protein